MSRRLKAQVHSYSIVIRQNTFYTRDLDVRQLTYWTLRGNLPKYTKYVSHRCIFICVFYIFTTAGKDVAYISVRYQTYNYKYMTFTRRVLDLY